MPHKTTKPLHTERYGGKPERKKFLRQRRRDVAVYDAKEHERKEAKRADRAKKKYVTENVSIRDRKRGATGLSLTETRRRAVVREFEQALGIR